MVKILFFLTALSFAFTAHCQSQLAFCTYVNSPTQECVFENTKFITTPDSTHARIFMFLRSAQVFGTDRLTFKIYGIDRFGAEVYLASQAQTVQPDWQNCWQPYTFTTPGKYMVKVYLGDTIPLTSRGFEFFNY